MRALFIRVANAAFLVASSYLVADMGNQWIAQAIQPPASTEVAAVQPVVPGNTDWRERQAILDRNLFGAQLVGDPTPVDEAVSEDVEETKLPLTLIATIASTDVKVARAAILDQRARKNLLVQRGDMLEAHPDVRVDRIERGRVLLMNRGRREELLLPEKLPGNAQPSPRTPVDQGRAERRPSRGRSTAAARAQARSRSLAETPEDEHGLPEELRERLTELSDRITSGELTPEEIQAEMEAIEHATP